MTAFISSSLLLHTVEENREKGMDIAGSAFLYFSVLPQTAGPYKLHSANVILVDYKVISSLTADNIWYCTLAVKTDNPDVYIILKNLRLKNVFIEGYVFNTETYELIYSPGDKSVHFAHCDNTGDIDKLIDATFQRADTVCRGEWLKLNKPKLSLVSSKE